MPARSRHRLNLWTFTAAAVVSGLLIQAPAAEAGSSASSTTVAYELDPLANSTLVEVQGVRVSTDGCRFTFEFPQVPGGPLLSAQEVSYDPTSCISILQVGERLSQGEGPGASHGPTLRTVRSGDTGTESNSFSSASIDYYAKGRAYFRDPPGFVVNDLIVELSWPSDGICNLFGGYGSAGYDQLDETGWNLDFNDLNLNIDCSQTDSVGQARWSNSLFCRVVINPFASTTRTSIDNAVSGLPSGIAAYWSDWTKEGGCSSLLAFRYDVLA